MQHRFSSSHDKGSTCFVSTTSLPIKQYKKNHNNLTIRFTELVRMNG